MNPPRHAPLTAWGSACVRSDLVAGIKPSDVEAAFKGPPPRVLPGGSPMLDEHTLRARATRYKKVAKLIERVDTALIAGARSMYRSAGAHKLTHLSAIRGGDNDMPSHTDSMTLATIVLYLFGLGPTTLVPDGTEPEPLSFGDSMALLRVCAPISCEGLRA